MEFTLSDLGLVDAPPQAEYDNLTKLAADLIGVPVSLLSIVEFENDRQFFKSHLGLPDPWATKQQTPLSHSFCQHVVKRNAPLVVDNAPEHFLVQDNLAIRDLGVIAYLGVPVCTQDGLPIGALCVIEGAPRQWTEQEVASLTQLAACVSDTIRLKEALLTSERLRKEQRDFVYAISHDLKSPANTINGLLTEISGEGLSDDDRVLIDAGIATSERMALQIEDILEYTRTIGNAEQDEPVDLNILIDAIAADLAGDLKSAGAVLNRGNLPIVFGSRMQLNSLFQNLLGNGIKFRLPDRTPVISITAQKDPLGRVDEISVADNGIGIAPENIGRIFDLFARLHVHEDYPGTGVGLAICNRVCANHHGSLGVASEHGAGTTFTVKLPQRQRLT